MADCDNCGRPDAETVPEGKHLRDGRWVNLTRQLCVPCQWVEWGERREKART